MKVASKAERWTFNIAILFTYICTTAVVCSEVVHPKGCRTGSNIMYQKALALDSFLYADRLFLVLANLPIIQFPMTLQLVNTS